MEQASAPVVAKRLCDLLMTFPAAAAGGVQWKVLASKYEERHAAHLSPSTFGHGSALGTASALLWDVLRIVDTADVNNPIVGVEDGVALAPQPGLLGCWPSLYQGLCSIVTEHGTLEESLASEVAGASSSMLLSQLRPLLERHWHANFDETGMGFRSDEGSFVRLKKMKHLLTAVIRWREERQTWQRRGGFKPSAVDEVLAPKLELIPSTKHNDLVLVCTSGEAMMPVPSVCRGSLEDGRSQLTSGPEPTRRHSLHSELDRLRAENEELRAQNLQMQGQTFSTCRLALPQLPAAVLDDPFEPPPEKRFWSEACSTKASSGATSPTSSVQEVRFGSVAHTTMMPVWFPVMPMPCDAMQVIPRGIVQSAMEKFDRAAC